MHLPCSTGRRPANRQGSEEEGEEETPGSQPQGPSPISRGEPGLLVYLGRCSHNLGSRWGLSGKGTCTPHVSRPPRLLGRLRFLANRAALFSHNVASYQVLKLEHLHIQMTSFLITSEQPFILRASFDRLL